MTEDARFEDGGERALRLKAEDTNDLEVLSTLAQDAIFPVSEISWDKTKRTFAFLLNRFRWEDAEAAKLHARDFERVQSVLLFEDVLQVATNGIDPKDNETILSFLSLAFEPGEDGSGQIELQFAGDGAIRLRVESINATLQDVTRPYIAPSKSRPEHPE